MLVSIGISNRHVHLTSETYFKLFGSSTLEINKDLKQPGQFASNSLVILKTEKSTIENVRILGPFRDYNQVEISKTDSYKLGLNPPVRDSGKLDDSEKITIVGPKCEIELENSCIIATRHIHISPQQIKMYNLEGKEKVSVRLKGEKGGIIDNVHLKIANNSYFELHLDTDDANAHLLNSSSIGEII